MEALRPQSPGVCSLVSRAAVAGCLAATLAVSCARGAARSPALTPEERAEQVAWDTHWSVSCDEPDAHACGLLTQGMLGLEGAREFVRRECDPVNDPEARVCVERFRTFFISRMQARYVRGFESVSAACEQLPIDCGNPVVYELVALTAHNYSLEHFPDAPYRLENDREKTKAKEREQQVARGVVELIHARIERCDRGELDCSCPEAGLGDAPCPTYHAAGDRPLPALPEEPEEPGIDWM